MSLQLDNALHLARSFSKSVLALVLTHFLAACTSSPPDRYSVLVIAADSLPSDLLTCSEAQESLGSLASLCAESVRYTHAFTTSTLSVPALSSVLTAELPNRTGVRDNGPGYLSAKWETVAEKALSNGYKTFFVSGGAPVWGRTGLSQGFEIFDDYVQPSLEKIYRPLEESSKQFLNWLKSSGEGQPFFAVLYTPEIQFIEIATRSEYGVSRDSSFLAQMEVFDRGLGSLINGLKAQKKWDKTIVVLVGLSGISPAERFDALPGSNLYAETSQVAMLIKPAGPKRDLGLSWKVDSNVSLQDIGQTLFDFIGSPRSPIGSEISLRQSLESPTNSIPNDRWLPVFEDWTLWRGIGGRRMAAINGSTLLILDDRIRSYNTLLDRSQVSPTYVTAVDDQLSSKLAEWGFALGTQTKNTERFRALDTARRLFSDQRLQTSSLERLKVVSKESADSVILSWASSIALAEKDWKWLEQVSAKLDAPLAVETAQRLSGGIPKLSIKKNDDECVKALKNPQIEKQREACRDSELQALLRLWKGPEAVQDYEVLARYLKRLKLERKILTLDYAAGFLWDGPPDQHLAPTKLELALLWPEFQRVAQTLRKDFGQ